MLIRRYEMPWRVAYEGYPAGAWLIGTAYFSYGAIAGAGPRGLLIGLAVACAVFCLWRALGAGRILKLRAALAGKAMESIDPARLRQWCADPNQLFLGFGFEWGPKHAQRVYELSKVNVRDFALARCWLRLFAGNAQGQPDTEIGASYIHGVEPLEYPIYRPLQNFEGGTCIIGTTQSGKGVCMSILASQAIYRGDVVVILDPKNSERLKNNVIRACADAGRAPPLDFHPAFPERGIRLDPMANWQKATELASRVHSILPAHTDGAFGAFAWNAANVVFQGMVEIEDRPNLRKLAHFVRSGIEGVLEPLLERFIQAEGPTEWRDAVRPWVRAAHEGKIRKPSEQATDQLVAYVAYYERELAPLKRNQSIDALIAVLRHNRDHYAKITANLLPVLDALTSGTLGKSLAPDPFDPADKRPIMDLGKVVRGGHVMYIALDSLPDPTVASAIGAIILADLAALSGMRYNLRHQDTRISLFVDEVSNVINRPLIEILNKGAESGLQVVCAMQTFSDLAERLGSTDAARMALGNLNNLIAFRSKDLQTQEFISETFGKTYIHEVNISYGARFDDHVHDFSADFSKSLSSTRQDIVPTEVLVKLPNLQYFASVSGGRLYKGRVPILNRQVARP